MNTLEGFKEYYSGLNGCCMMENTQDLVNRSVELLAFVESEPDEARGAAITKLDDGKYATFEEWQDYSGHGCQCDCWSDVHDTYDHAIRFGLDERGRDVLGIKLPE